MVTEYSAMLCNEVLFLFAVLALLCLSIGSFTLRIL